MSRDIFISHAVKDKPLADLVVDLLQLGLDLSSEQIFCSSLEGLGIPSGLNFVSHIKEQIQSPKAVIALITPNYYASQFCLCELGAAWAMSHRFFPLLAAPLKFDDVKGVLTGVQITPLDSAKQLSELRDTLTKILNKTSGSTARWEIKRDSFLEKLSGLLKTLPTPESVSPAAYKQALAELDDAKRGLAEQLNAQSQLEKLVASLSNAKDKTEVASIKRAHRSDSATLSHLVEELAETLAALPRCASFLAYKELGQGEDVRINSSRDQDFAVDAASAAEDQIVEIDDLGNCKLNGQHPKVKKMARAYRELERFVESAPPELADNFEEENEVPLSLANREYWTQFIDGRISRFT